MPQAENNFSNKSPTYVFQASYLSFLLPHCVGPLSAHCPVVVGCGWPQSLCIAHSPGTIYAVSYGNPPSGPGLCPASCQDGLMRLRPRVWSSLPLDCSEARQAGPGERKKKRVVFLVRWEPGSEAGGARGSAPKPPLMVAEAVTRARTNTHAVLTLCKVQLHSPGVGSTIKQMRKLRHRQVTCSRSHDLEMVGFELR